MKAILAVLLLLCVCGCQSSRCSSGSCKPVAQTVSTPQTVRVVIDDEGKEVGTQNRDGSYTINGERFVVVLGMGECTIDGKQCVKAASIK